MSKVDLIIQSSSTILYPIVEEGISLSWDRKGSPGKLKFSVVKDSVLSFQEGDAVKLSVDGTDMFYGFVFTRAARGARRTLSRLPPTTSSLLQDKDTYVYSNKKASDVIKMIAEDFGLSVGTLEDTGYVIGSRTEDNTTLFDIAQNAA